MKVAIVHDWLTGMRGGALETVVPCDQEVEIGRKGPTGLFFYELITNSLIDALGQFTKTERDFNPALIRNCALRWDREIFKEMVEKNILEKVGLRC
jgi:hypothetical protein